MNTVFQFLIFSQYFSQFEINLRSFHYFCCPQDTDYHAERNEAVESTNLYTGYSIEGPKVCPVSNTM